MDSNSTRVIDSDAYGTLEVKAEQIYFFPRGIIGLPDYKEYAFIPFEDAPFNILHALDEQLSFFLLPAHDAVKDYGFEIDQATIELLHIEKPEEVATYLIVNIVDDGLYVNLKAPVLVSLASRHGCQIILDDPALPIRHPLISREGAAC